MKKIDIPNVNKEGNSEKKSGLFGFLRGGASGASGVTPGVIGGTANASSGLLAMLTGKLATVLISTVILGGIGTMYMARNASDNAMDSGELMASAQEAAEYVPAIQRSEAANDGKSSLGMFNETNKGSISFDIDPTLNNKNKQDNSEYDAMADDAVSSAASAQDMAADAMSEAAGKAELNSSNLSTSLGSDRSSKSMNMSGAAPRLKPTFKSMASNSFRPMGSVRNGKGGKDLAMARANKAGTIGTDRARSRKGSRAFGQAKAMGAMMARASSGLRNYEASRATMDAAWEGTTAEGDATETIEAGGLGEGEAMTVDPLGTGAPSANSATTGGGIPGVNAPKNYSPWQGLLDAINYMYMAAMAVIMIGAAMAEIKPWGYIAYGVAACIAGAMCIAIVAMAATLKSKYGQDAMGDMWITVGAISLVAAIAMAALGFAGGQAGIVATHATMAAVITTICASIGMSIGSSTYGNSAGKADYEEGEKYCSEPKHQNEKGCKTSSLPYELSDSPVNRGMLC